jgi:biotin-dependent carboxylase-like uncharacterized protein
MGVPVSGVMDGHSAAFANSIVGNPKDAALLECTLIGPKLLVEEDATIAIAGAHFLPTIDGNSVTLNSRLHIKKGSILTLGTATEGMYGYIAIQGGLISDPVLGSQSFYNGITKKTKLEKGDRLNFETSDIPLEKSNSNMKPHNFDQHSIEVFAGPDFNSISKKELEILLKTEYKISSLSNRMATLFEGSGVGEINEILTAPVQPGTVQITPSGKLIILMRDAQTTGGYGRIFQLSEAAINLLSQKRPGSLISFQLIG